MRRRRTVSLSALLVAGAVFLPLLAGSTTAIAASPRATPPIGANWAELEGSGTIAGGQFGSSVAVSGATVVVGSPGDAKSPGAAYVFTKTVKGWLQVAELKAPQGVAGSNFGYSVAVSGTAVVVGAPGVLSSPAFNGSPAVVGSPGQAYVFTRTTKGWLQVAELRGYDTAAGDNFGCSVSISGTTVVVGATGHADGAGRAYVFTETGTVWHQAAELWGSDTSTGDNFGYSVAISGVTVIVGAPLHAGTNGNAYVFTRAETGWRQVTELGASDITGLSYDELGESVAVSGGSAVVGAPNYGNDGGGRTYVYLETTTGWMEAEELDGYDTVANDKFGASVAISGTVAVTTDPNHAKGAGCVYVFAKTVAGWTEVAELRSSDTVSGDELGTSVAISGVTAVVGAPGHADSAGRTYVFEA